MKILKQTCRLALYLAGGAVILHLGGHDAFASETGGDWRPTYDLVMKWVNFGILAFVVLKFGKGPIMKFLRGQGEEVATEIEALETEKNSVAAKIRDARQAMKESDVRFEDLKKRITRQGDKKKQEIIEEAHQQCEAMMSMAKQKVDNQIVQARRTFRAEMIDAAINLATQKLPSKMTDEDNEKLIRLYLSSASAK